MATFSLVRDTRVYISTAQSTGSMTDLNTWEVPVLDGYSFTAETDVETITVSEAGTGAVARGQQAFTNAIQPVDWSLTTYMRPRWGGSPDLEADAVERVLWEGLAGPKAGQGAFTTKADGVATTLGGAGAGMNVNFLSSNTNELLELSIVFNLGTIWYQISGVLVNQAEIDFSIDAIAQITWSGFGTTLAEVADPGWGAGTPRFPNSGISGGGDFVTAPSTYACIRNKLSTLRIKDNTSPLWNSGNPTEIAITGGSLTINNNIEYLTPEILGVVNQPCGGFTGTREVSGELTAYLKDGTGTTSDLLANLAADLNTVTNDFLVEIAAGGPMPDSAGTDKPVVYFDMPHCHIAVPTIDVQDVLSVNIGFTALPTDSAGAYDLEANNEIEVTYYPDEA